MSLADPAEPSSADLAARETTWSAVDLDVSAEAAPDSDTADTADTAAVEPAPVPEAAPEAADDPDEDDPDEDDPDEDDPYAGTSDEVPALAAAWAPGGRDWPFCCAAVT